MKNILLFSLLTIFSLASCKSTQKANTASNCCKDIEPNTTNILKIPDSYTRKCGTSQCLQLLENQNLDCVSFKLFTRFGNEIIVFNSDISIRIEDFTKELDGRLAGLEHSGVYLYIVKYKMNNQCFSNKAHINIL